MASRPSASRPPARRPRVVVAGYLIRHPLGGHAMGLLQWLVGLHRLGCDVAWIESFGWPSSCYDPRFDEATDDPTYGIGQLLENTRALGIDGIRWCYRDASGTLHGMSASQLRAACRDADVLLGHWEATWFDEMAESRCRVFIDSDPGFTQFRVPEGTVARSTEGYASFQDFHLHYSVGTRIGAADCPIPAHGLRWRPLRHPVALDVLRPAFRPDAELFTTVMGWSTRKPVVHDGVEYGQKDVELARFLDLPSRLGRVFEIAIGGRNPPVERLTAAGWRLRSGRAVSATPWTYREYLAGSRGEFSVATNLEVKSRSGWFSDRTAAYLATGKPAIVQDTGFSESLPCGEGLFGFATEEDVERAMAAIAADYRRHCEAARRIAEESFDVRKIVGGILRDCGVAVRA